MLGSLIIGLLFVVSVFMVVPMLVALYDTTK